MPPDADLSLLGVGAALMTGYMGNIFSKGLKKASQQYEPTASEERQLFLEERRLLSEKEERWKQEQAEKRAR